MFSIKIFKISEKHLEASAKSIIFAVKFKKERRDPPEER